MAFPPFVMHAVNCFMWFCFVLFAFLRQGLSGAQAGLKLWNLEICLPSPLTLNPQQCAHGLLPVLLYLDCPGTHQDLEKSATTAVVPASVLGNGKRCA